MAAGAGAPAAEAHREVDAAAAAVVSGEAGGTAETKGPGGESLTSLPKCDMLSPSS